MRDGIDLGLDAAAIRPLDGLDKVTGTARYTFDLALPDMLHAKILRSPHAHARIVAIDASRALALPGVVTVVTGADAKALPDCHYGVFIRDQPVLPYDKVRYVGDMVAVAVAVDEVTAFRALALIDVIYEPLPAVMTIDAAQAPGAPVLFEQPMPGIPVRLGDGLDSLKEPRPNVLYEFGYRNGDAAAVLAGSAQVFTDSFWFSRINHFHLEPHVNVARVTGDQIELWSCNQDPFVLRNDVARTFGVPTSQVRIHASYVGGGFGGKSYCKMEPLVVLCAMKARRPVRLCLSMDESLLTLTKHAGRLTLTTGVDAAGRLTARRSVIELDGGAYSDASAMTAVKAGYRITGPYRWQAVDSRAWVVRTNSVPAGSFRGFGGTQASYASEAQIDMIARRLGEDPYAFRRRNLLAVGEDYQPGDSAMDSDLARGLDEVVERIGYRRRARGGDGPTARGMGLSIGLKDGGGTGNHAQALVKVLPNGRVLVHTATVEIGQGATTALCRIAALVLGVPLDWVRYGAIDTDHTPLNNGTHVSCATTVTGNAVARAAEDAKRQILGFAAEQLGCAPEALKLEGGAVRRGNVDHPLEPMVQAWFGGAGFEFIGRGVMKVPYDARAPLYSPNLFWVPCWVGAEVEVDRETGKVTVLQLIAGTDSGRSVNPAACRGQVEGAALQAFGQSLFESVEYAGEQPANATPLRYRVPLATDLPARWESFMAEHGHGPGPDGAKGIGEAGMLGIASAIANAIEDATGARVTDMPFTPERVLAALDAAQAPSA